MHISIGSEKMPDSATISEAGLDFSASMIGDLPDGLTSVASLEYMIIPTLKEPVRESWESAIDRHLIEWGRNPRYFDNAEITAPSKISIDKATQFARCRKQDGSMPGPMRVVPDGDGGIAFEFSIGDSFVSIDVGEEGRIVLNVFRDCKLLLTQRIG